MYCYLPYRIPFSETDQMGIVHHSNHARYFERGRVEMLRLLDFGYKKIVDRGAHFPLTEMNIRFRRPLFFDDIILIETKIAELSETRLSFTYRIIANQVGWIEGSLQHDKLTEQALVLARTDHCCVNNAGRPQPIPADIYALLKKHWKKNDND